MKLYLDMPQGHELDSGIGVGRISRMGLAVANVGELPSVVPSATQLIKALQLFGLPQKGDSYPHPDYQDYFMKRHILRAFNALHYGIEMIYEFRGLMTVQDTSTLSGTSSQLHPKDFSPLYVKYGGGDPKVLTLQSLLPLRHLVISKTVDFVASGDVLTAFGGVNDRAWQGKPKGYWLFSGIDASTVDEGITYTYTATFSTKQKEDWSQVGFLEDPQTGQPVYVPPASVRTLRAKPYEYAMDDSVDGILKVGMHDVFNFFGIFGI